jgi:cereblon
MSDIVLVSDAGATGSFVNPGGAVHDMITVSGASAGPKLRLHGVPSSEHSWFPGYQWTIASCGTCGTHMGWRFTPEPGETNAEEAAALDAFVEVNEGLPVAARRFADETSRRAMDTARTIGGRREAEFYGILRRATVAAEEEQGPGPRLQVRRVRDDVVIAFDDGDEDDDDEFEVVDDGSDDVGDADDDEVSVD